MLDNRLLALLDEMIHIPVLTYWELGNVFELPVDQIKKDVETINRELNRKNIVGLVIDEQGYQITDNQLSVKQLLKSKRMTGQIVVTEEERLYLIYLYTFTRTELLSNFHYQYLLQVSKNTIISDIKKVNQRITCNSIGITYTRSEGYHLEGEESAKRKQAIIYVGKLLNIPIGKWLIEYVVKGQTKTLVTVAKTLQEEMAIRHFSFVNDRLENILYFVTLLAIRVRRVGTLKEKPLLVRELPVSVQKTALEIVAKVYPQDTGANEVGYLATLLLGAIEGNPQEVDHLFRSLTNEIIDKMEAVAVVRFEHREELFNHLYGHLVPAFYRLVFGNTLQNDLTDYIKYTHEALFELVREALTPLAELANSHLSEDELSYFVIHFGGQIDHQSKDSQKYKAVIICPNGISSSLILKQELQQLFPQFEWDENRSLLEFEQLEPNSYDLVFSTIYVGSSKPVYLVKPLMDNLFKQYLLQKVSKDFNLSGYHHIELAEVMTIVEKYATVHQPDKLKKELLIKLLPQKKNEDVSLPVLNELITAERVQLIENKDELTWQHAIRLSGAPLLAEGVIEPEYLEAIITKVTNLGAFIDLGSGIAIPHARPEEGVNELGMSILKLATPVKLLDDVNHSVSVLICIAAIDNVSHLKALSQLTEVLMDTVKINRLKTAETVAAILTLLSEGGEANND